MHTCKHCRRPHDPTRCIGWDRAYCSPLCERNHAARQADAFKAWWDRPRVEAKESPLTV